MATIVRRIPRNKHGATVPVIVCCGEELECWNFTNTCERCEADYNFAGQTLAPRRFWGEETGEHPSECV